MKYPLLCTSAFLALFSTHVSAQGTFPTADDIIYEAPEGTLHANQVRNARSYFDPGEGLAEQDSVNYYTADYVETTEGSLYLKNPFTFFPSDTWLRLDKEADGAYIAHLPQAIYEDEDGTVYYARRMNFNLEGDGSLTLSPDETETDVRFTLRDDTLRMVSGGDSEGGYPRFVMALATQKGGWSCYAEATMTVFPISYQPLVAPDEAYEDYYTFAFKDLWHGDQALPMPTMRYGNKIYWQGTYLSNYDESYWMEGELSDGKLIVKPQYIGVDSWSCLHLFAMPAVYQPNSTSLEPYELTDELVLTYDKERGAYLPADENQTILFNVGPEKVYYADAYHAPEMRYIDAVGSPETPVVTQVTPYDAQQGKGSVDFLFTPNVEDRDYQITKDNLYYRIYVDDSTTPYVFRPQQYTALEQEMTDVNYYFTDSRDFLYDGAGLSSGTDRGYVHRFNLYQPFDSVGIQTIYRDGTPQKSDIVWTTGRITSGVTSPQQQHAVASAVYTLGGVRMQRPSRQGVVIRRKADGTTAKEVVK